MISLRFEWDPAKAASNLAKHRIPFETAARAFDDVHGQHFVDRSMTYGEERLIGIAIVDGVVLTIVYTERGDTIRLISARKATRFEQRICDEARTGNI